MNRTKPLLAVLAAAVALIAIAAPSASAGYFSVSAGSTSFTAKAVEQSFTQPGGLAGSCTTGGGFSGSVANLDKSLGGSPTDMSCGSSYEGAISWSWKGCSVTFNPGNANTGGTLDGTYSIGPAGCGPIQVNSASCEKRIGAQSGAATFTNVGGAVTAEIPAGSLAYTVVKSSANCKSGTLTYHGKWSLTTASGSISALSSKVGLFFQNPTFEAQTPAYPVNVSASQGTPGEQVLTLVGGRRVKCDSIDFSGQLAGPSTTLDLAPQYAGCALEAGASKLPTTVDAGSCSYRLHAGSLDVVCQSEGDSIELTTYANATKQAEGVPLCVYQIAPQKSVSGIGMGNVGEGSEAAIRVTIGLSNLVYSRVLGTIGNCGEAKSTATYTGQIDLKGMMA